MTPRPHVLLLSAGLVALILAHQGWWTVTAEGAVVSLTGAEASAGLLRTFFDVRR